MPLDDDVVALRDQFELQSVTDAAPYVRSLVRLGRPRSVALVFADKDRKLVDLLWVQDADTEDIARTVAMACCTMPEEVTSLLVVSNRTGEIPADRPDDELIWEDMVDLAAIVDITVLDWLIAWGTKAFSVTEFADYPAHW